MDFQNENPIVYSVVTTNIDKQSFEYDDENEREYVNKEEIFEYLRHLNDPEHPLTLEQLNVVSLNNIVVLDPGNFVHVRFTPTIPHCSMATLIGLSIRVKLLRSLPPKFKVLVEVTPGSHRSGCLCSSHLISHRP